MEIVASKVEIINEVSGESEASVRVENTVMTVDEAEAAVKGLSQVVARALDHHDQPAALSFVARTDVQI